ncbi:hypothetical protein D9758_018573 [Tetrapyrgos nigripes]|uniref:Uncharacterized protein n=1 Tax=Tetrapyrgos nigripes TaxID=182062 RepID=A0A8H5B1W9_9AGAR|nr:hypothetical protein D9758_018573 [Tetrapyrgos nigripes]
MLFPALTLAPTLNANVNPNPIQTANLPALLSPTSLTSPGPATLLSQGVSTLPNLRYFQLPTVWNEVLLTERLKKSVLGSLLAFVCSGIQEDK